MAEIRAIDVSAWQEKIDWKKVADAKVKVAILRCTAGSSDLKVKDKYFEDNYAGATKNGINVGVYRFSYAKTLNQIKEEANGVVAALKGKTIQYPVFLDLEWDWQQKNLTKAQLGDFIDAFKTIIEKAGYTFGIYCNLNWIRNILPASAQNHPLWIARYPSEDKGVIREDLRISSSMYKNCIGWQYSSKGKVSGINGNVDMDVFYKDYAAGKGKEESVGYSRDTVVKIMQGWVGKKESDGSFKVIIDTYNKISPLPVGYKMKYYDEWCAATVSAAFHKAGYDAIFPSECGCGRMVDKAKKMGIWKESDSYVPSPGDCIMYDWQDTGKGDNTGSPDHVGMVEKVTNNVITVIEGNKSEQCGRRALSVNGRYIRGFICPKFSSQSTKKAETSKTSSTKKKSTVATIAAKYKVGKTYTVQVNDLTVRTGAGTSYAKKTKKQLTADGQKHSNAQGQLKKGIEVTCMKVKTVGSNVWIQIPSGWVCAYYGTSKKYYVK